MCLGKVELWIDGKSRSPICVRCFVTMAACGNLASCRRRPRWLSTGRAKRSMGRVGRLRALSPEALARVLQLRGIGYGYRRHQPPALEGRNRRLDVQRPRGCRPIRTDAP